MVPRLLAQLEISALGSNDGDYGLRERLSYPNVLPNTPEPENQEVCSPLCVVAAVGDFPSHPR
jgi:hypothetical protein